MKHIKYILYIAIAVIAASCQDFLDVKPAGRLIPEKGDVSSFEKLLNNNNTLTGAFINNNDGCRLNYLTDDIDISDNQADYGWYDGHPNIDSYFAHIYRIPYDNPNWADLYTWWMDYYRAVEYFNICIDGINSVKTANEEKFAQETISQAVVARSYIFFNLSLIYGPTYVPGAANNTKTIPMRVQSDILAPMENLSTTKEVFETVLKEIHTSLPNMPERVLSPSRFSKVSTFAFLANYHLFTQKFDSVAFYANKALEMAAAQNGGMDNLFFDMNKFSWADAGVATDPNKKNASSINTSQGSNPLTANYHREMLLYRECANPPSLSTGYPAQNYISLFDQSYDLRREYFFFEFNGFMTIQNGVTYNDGRRVLNYQNKMARTSGLSYPELLLLRAEGRARTNDLSGAVADLNLLKKYRMKPGFTPFTSSNKDAVITEVINERRRELPVGSPKRFLDLKRLSLDSGKPWSKSEIIHKIKGNPYVGIINSEHFIVPIQNDVILNNPHWGIETEKRPWNNTK